MEVSLTVEEMQGLQARVAEFNRQQFIANVLQRETQMYAGEIAKKHGITAPFEISPDLTKLIKKEEETKPNEATNQPSPAGKDK